MPTYPIRAKSVDGEKPFPVNRKPGSRKYKSPSALRRQRARKQRFHEKKAAEKADLPKSPASGVNTTVLQEPESSVSSKDSCIDLDVTGHAQDLACSKDKCSENQTLESENIQSPADLATERALLLDILHHTDTDSDDNSFEFPDINVCSKCKRQP